MLQPRYMSFLLLDTARWETTTTRGRWIRVLKTLDMLTETPSLHMMESMEMGHTTVSVLLGPTACTVWILSTLSTLLIDGHEH